MTVNGKPVQAYPGVARRLRRPGHRAHPSPPPASITSPATRWNAWPRKKSAAAIPCAARCSGPVRRTSTSQPSSCPMFPARRRWSPSVTRSRFPKTRPSLTPTTSPRSRCWARRLAMLTAPPASAFSSGQRRSTFSTPSTANTLSGQPGGPDLTHAVDFGFFSLIARPLFLWLLWTHDHMAPNWGVSIIILTVIINLALLPLRITSMKFGAEDAKAAAADEGHPGEVQEISDARSPARRHERRDLRALQGAWRQPRRWLLAAGHSDAVPVRVLLDAWYRDRTAPGAVPLAARPVVARQALHSAGADRDQHAVRAEDDAQPPAWIRRSSA